MSEEQIYTSSNVKLLKHLERMIAFQQHNQIKPITLQVAPTDRCSLNCEFCSVKKRLMKEWKFTDLCKAILSFKNLGVKAVEITGGGDPTCYDHINELIEFCHNQHLKIGMITNGVYLTRKVAQEQLDSLTWLRISLNALDYVRSLDIPKIKGTLGFSYVWIGNGNPEEKLAWLVNMKQQHKASFVRVVPNCLSIKDIENFKQTIKPYQNKFKELFFQTKDYSKPDSCIFGYFKPFLNSDGYVYRCSAIPLINQRFDKKWRMCHWKDIEKTWSKPEWFCTKDCGLCFFKAQNDLLTMLLLFVPHEEWI
jgi:MoaA/NifB/PqqE/SkfB family radical SAM enzyme